MASCRRDPERKEPGPPGGGILGATDRRLARSSDAALASPAAARRSRVVGAPHARIRLRPETCVSGRALADPGRGPQALGWLKRAPRRADTPRGSMALAFDVLVIGSGPAGEKAAVQAAKQHRRVAVVERGDRLGGSCLHTATIPSKTLRETILYIAGVKQ